MDLIHEEDTENISEVPIPTRTVLSSIELLNHLKELFNKESCTKEQKMQILTLLPKSWSTSDVMKHFNISRRLIEKARGLLYNKGMLSLPSPKQGKL